MNVGAVETPSAPNRVALLWRARAPARLLMAHLYRDLSVKSLYTDRKYNGG